MDDLASLIQQVNEHIAKLGCSSIIKEIRTPAEDAQLDKELKFPDIRPQDFDVTIVAWLIRLQMWGTVSITHTQEEKGIKNQSVSSDRFDRMLGDTLNLKVAGKWDVELQAVDRVKFVRHYIGANAKEYQEYFIVKIDLRKDILSKLKKSDPFGWIGVK